jgi:hypothetical protein
MSRIRTVLVRTLGAAFISSLAITSIGCGEDDKDTSERDASIEGNNSGTNGGGNAANTDGTNGSSTNGGNNANNDGTNGSGTNGDSNGGSNANNDGTNGSGTNGGSNGGNNAANNDGSNGSATNGGSTTGSGNGICGGIVGAACPDGYFCNLEEEAGGTGCHADGAGVCQEKPSGCPAAYDPVCSCDIRTHSNACTAHASGASILHKGACTAQECQMIGGRVVVSTGANIPMCEPGEIGFQVGNGIEPDMCCVKE